MEVQKTSRQLFPHGKRDVQTEGSKEQSRYKKEAADNSGEDKEVWWRIVKRNKGEDSKK